MRYCLAYFALFLLVCGCSGPSKPDGLPDRLPFEVTLTQDGKPLSEASVQLVSPDVPWAITGNTDATGKAKVVTHGQFGGVPPGLYKVIVAKHETETTLSDDKKMQTLKIYSLVDPQYIDRNTTTLELTVEKEKKSATLDVGSPIRVLINTETMPTPEF
jgi:hypothetical protein